MSEPTIGSKWRPKNDAFALHWKLTKVFTSEDGEKVYRIEKYQGGRNSPAVLTLRKLKQQFVEK